MRQEYVDRFSEMVVAHVDALWESEELSEMREEALAEDHRYAAVMKASDDSSFNQFLEEWENDTWNPTLEEAMLKAFERLVPYAECQNCEFRGPIAYVRDHVEVVGGEGEMDEVWFCRFCGTGSLVKVER